MKDNVTKLYGFIAKLMHLLENDISFVEDTNSKNSIVVKKNITDILSKLVALLVQLNKISKDQDVNNEDVLETNDQDIINLFLNNHK